MSALTSAVISYPKGQALSGAGYGADGIFFPWTSAAAGWRV